MQLFQLVIIGSL